ncbi:hypothetical protein HYW18_01040 [Candidatus Uhrbacteria bacterium]|nr:hypothetical protein [Candidatus Uhrbacteria bacterium]
MDESHWRESSTPGTVVLACGHEVADPAKPHYCTYIGLRVILPAAGEPNVGSAHTRAAINHEEANFIVVHQACELALLRVIRELEMTRDAIEKDDSDGALPHMRWAISWMKSAIDSTRLLFRMDKDLFMKKGVGFRDEVVPASGAESAQAREVELLAGMRSDSPYMTIHGRTFTFRGTMNVPAGMHGRSSRWWTLKMEERARTPSVVCRFKEALVRAEIALGDLMSDAHKGHPLRRLAQAIWRFEKTYLDFRQVHLKLAIHFLGPNTAGTAGSDGVPYLDAILRTARLYPELWAIMKDVKSPKPEGAWDH